MRKGFPEASNPCNRKPVPESVATWTSPDGTPLGVRQWRPPGESRVTVAAIHGLGCRAEDFAPLGEAFRRQGIRLVAWDLRGQGLDPEIARRGAWLDAEGHRADLENLVSRLVPEEQPLILCGESMGALLALQIACREPWRDRLAGLMLFSPVVALAQENPPWLKTLLRLVSKLAPGLRLRPGWFVHGSAAMPQLTRVPERQQYLATAPHRLGPLSLGFLASMADLIEAAPQLASQLEMPVAVFSAGHDVFVTPGQTRDFFARIPCGDRTHFAYDESYHQLLFDLDAERVVADAAEWISRRWS